MDFLHHLLVEIVAIAIILFEYIGVFILIAAGIRGTIQYIKRDPLTGLNLAKGMAMGLEFKLGSEILKTVTVQDYREILMVAGIIVLRASLTFLIHWEIGHMESHDQDNKHIETH